MPPEVISAAASGIADINLHITSMTQLTVVKLYMKTMPYEVLKQLISQMNLFYNTEVMAGQILDVESISLILLKKTNFVFIIPM
jgi:hypothetical protein